ncbi:MAG: UbiA family prenyltransferase [FCB group bacterium]|nr:UbiA family prenyltransferase [FCB group bacterium]
MVTKLFDLIFFGRPMLLIPVWTVFLHFHAVILQTDNTLPFAVYPQGPGNEVLIILIGLSLLASGTYTFNQIFDIETDRFNDKLFFLPREIISIRTAWTYSIIMTLAGLGIIAFVSYATFFPALMMVGLGILYSLPRVKLKDRTIEGLLANAVAYGFLVPRLAMAGEGLTPGIFVSTLPYFLAIAVGYIMTTIPDAEGDALSGKKTVAVVLGPQSALWLAFLTTLATAAASLWTRNYEILLVAMVTLIMVVSLLFSLRPRALMAACKLPILMLTILAGIHYPFYLLLLLLTIIITRIYYKRRFGIIYPKLG